MAKKLILPETVEQAEEELERTENKVIPFTLLTGGKGPPNADWLTPLDIGTCFLCKPSDPNYKQPFLGEWYIWNRTGKYTLLKTVLNKDEFAWVEAEGFCKLMTLVHVFKQEEETNE